MRGKSKQARMAAVVQSAIRLMQALENDENHLGKSLAGYVADTTCSCPCLSCPADALLEAMASLDVALAEADPAYERFYMDDEGD